MTYNTADRVRTEWEKVNYKENEIRIEQNEICSLVIQKFTTRRRQRYDVKSMK